MGGMTTTATPTGTANAERSVGHYIDSDGERHEIQEATWEAVLAAMSEPPTR